MKSELAIHEVKTNSANKWSIAAISRVNKNMVLALHVIGIIADRGHSLQGSLRSQRKPRDDQVKVEPSLWMIEGVILTLAQVVISSAMYEIDG